VRLDLLVSLKTVDLVRETAWLALTGQLGWGERLLDLKRYRLWRFAAPGAALEAEVLRAALAAAIERSPDFYNPNKERLRWAAPGELVEGEALAAPAGSPPPALPPAGAQPWRLGLWVTDEGGAASGLARRTAAQLAAAGLVLPALELATGSYWELTLAAADRAEALALAGELAVSRGRHAGLLLNPHYQEGRLLAESALPAAPAAGLR